VYDDDMIFDLKLEWVLVRTFAVDEYEGLPGAQVKYWRTGVANFSKQRRIHSES